MKHFMLPAYVMAVCGDIMVSFKSLMGSESLHLEMLRDWGEPVDLFNVSGI